MLLEIQDKIVSLDLFEKKFVSAPQMSQSTLARHQGCHQMREIDPATIAINSNPIAAHL